MKNITLLPGLILVISIFSCKKGNDAPASGSALPKTYTEDIRSSAINSVITYNLTYDSKNRLISLAATPEPSIIKFVYQYPDEKTVTMDLYNNAQLSIHEKFWLNGFSLVDSTFQYNDSQDSSTEKYFYDPNHLITTVNNYDYAGGVSTLSNQTQYTYDNNGNALTQSDYSGTTSFTYYTDLPYTLSTGLTFILGPKYFIQTASSNASGSLVTATHYYKFDSSNRLIQDSAYVSGADVIAVKSYTY
jgi:YD repeat-containing protein